MKERPILFNGEMVRAILGGRKTQTRRVIKPQPPNGTEKVMFNPTSFEPDYGFYFAPHGGKYKCPYGVPGDRLWVRETHAIVPRTAYAQSDGVQQVLRPDDNHDAAIFKAGWDLSPPGRWKPSIHMPRWASRILLEITDIRVERVQDIRCKDLTAEGINEPYIRPRHRKWLELWNSINEKKGFGWDVNPWVWVIEFRRVKP